MKKEKLTPRALNSLINDCSVDGNTTVTLEISERTNNGKDVTKRKIDFNKLTEKKERFRYLLAQTHPYASTDKDFAISRQFSLLGDETQWTRDPIDLQRLTSLGTALGLIGPFTKQTFNYTQNGVTKPIDVYVTNLNWKGIENRIKPVVHEDKMVDDK